MKESTHSKCLHSLSQISVISSGKWVQKPIILCEGGPSKFMKNYLFNCNVFIVKLKLHTKMEQNIQAKLLSRDSMSPKSTRFYYNLTAHKYKGSCQWRWLWSWSIVNKSSITEASLKGPILVQKERMSFSFCVTMTVSSCGQFTLSIMVIFARCH